MDVDLRQVVLTLSDALDFVGVDDTGHGKRVAWIATQIGHELGLPVADRDDLLLGGLLHDCGVSSTREHRAITARLEWEGADSHSQRGSKLLASFEPLAHLGPMVRHHHHRWQDLDPEQRDHRLADILHLADRVDALLGLGAGRDPLMVGDSVVQAMLDRSGTLFGREACAALRSVSRREAFWLALLPESLPAWVGYAARATRLQPIQPHELRQLAGVFSQIVDAKSPFTARHSQGVARVAHALATELGLPRDQVELLEIAGLLHDIGKLRVPDRVLDKPAPLDTAERAAMTRHSFYTWHTLRRIRGLDQLAGWAGFHHESPQGDGYPFHLGGGQLDVGARVVAVADVLQALAQDRPYRSSLPPERCRRILSGLAGGGKLDGDLVGVVVRDIDRYWHTAVD